MLTIETRKKYFDYLGLGEYKADNVRKLQKKYFTDQREWDGVYGKKTDVLLRHVYNVKRYTKNFTPQEFRCSCGGRWCTGYPDYLKKHECLHIQKIRDYTGVPVQITSGLRCKTYNGRLLGSSSASGHLCGKAVDFYARGFTDSIHSRGSLISVIKKYPNHYYSYGNGIDSYGNARYAPNMGNAVHTETR